MGPCVGKTSNGPMSDILMSVCLPACGVLYHGDLINMCHYSTHCKVYW